jgi:hypothetical protein
MTAKLRCFWQCATSEKQDTESRKAQREREAAGNPIALDSNALHFSLKVFDLFLQSGFLAHEWLDVLRFDALLDVERAELSEQARESRGA